VANGEAETQLAKARAPMPQRFARPAMTALLLLIVIAGISAASPASSGGGPFYRDALTVGVALELMLACLEIALAVVARRAAAAGQPAAALRAALRRVIAVVMIAVVVIAVANIAARKHGNLLQHFLTGGHKPSPRKRAPLQIGLPGGTADHGGYLVYGLIAVVVLAALIALIVVVARARTRPGRLGGYADEPPADEQDDLRKAIDSGLRALHAVDDARAAIIACYVAMEASLASAGTARTVAETPDELLSRAAAAGLVRGPAATSLTRLFYEARFSTHPLAIDAKDAARQALDTISAELASRTDPSPASEPAAGATI
jgi:Domain of unknown function (DUF4129)